MRHACLGLILWAGLAACASSASSPPTASTARPGPVVNEALQSSAGKGGPWEYKFNGTLGAEPQSSRIVIGSDLSVAIRAGKIVVTMLLHTSLPYVNSSAPVPSTTTAPTTTALQPVLSTPKPLKSYHAQLVASTSDFVWIGTTTAGGQRVSDSAMSASGATSTCYPDGEHLEESGATNSISVSGSEGVTFEAVVKYAIASIAFDEANRVIVDGGSTRVLFFDYTQDLAGGEAGLRVKVRSDGELTWTNGAGAKPLGRPPSPVAFVLSQPPDVVRCPDLAGALQGAPRSSRATFLTKTTFSISSQSRPPLETSARYYVGIHAPTGWSVNATVEVVRFEVNQPLSFFLIVALPATIMLLMTPGFCWIMWGRSTSTTFRDWLSLPRETPRFICQRVWRMFCGKGDSLFFRYDPTQNYVFTWMVMAVAGIWIIVSWQVVYGRWALMVDTGNRDLCFYNEDCYQPLTWWDVPFNNIASNGGYVIAGILICVVNANIYKRAWEYQDNKMLDEDPTLTPFRVDVSMHYALGICLIAVGLNSSIYHICPSRPAFQFDTSFMFVIAALIFVALGQIGEIDKRHFIGARLPLQFLIVLNPPAGHMRQIYKAGRFFSFFVFPLLLFNFLGVWVHGSDSVFYKSAFVLAVLVWEVGIVRVVVKRTFNCGRDCSCKEFLGVLFGLFLLLLVPLGLLSGNDPANVFLYPLVLIAVLSMLYSAMARCKLERPCRRRSDEDGPWHAVNGRRRAVYYIVFIILCTIFSFLVAGSNFQANTTNKTVTPEESRQLNKPCSKFGLGYQDFHDVWHLFGSIALFGLLVLVLLLNPPRREADFRYRAEQIYQPQKDRSLRFFELEMDESVPSRRTSRAGTMSAASGGRTSSVSEAGVRRKAQSATSPPAISKERP